MDIGIGLPTTVPGISGQVLVGWARRAEQHGFSSLGVLDRLVHDNYDPLVSLAAAAAVTQRIQLATTI
ncbi:MAG: LLM class flavin-dependent oxidoreductase, partial [Pseudonocardiaceae bacterium]